MTPPPRRLRRLPRVDGTEIRRAEDPLARLLGLAWLRGLPAGCGLLLPRTRSVHTIGMRFPLDLVWLDPAGCVVRVDRAVPPWRVRVCRHAAQVMELPSGADA